MALRLFLCISILVGLLASSPTVAQTNKTTIIRGRVVDAQTNEPLPRTHVFISRSMNGTITDSTGHFHLEGIPPGSKRLFVSRVGYEDEAVTLRLRRSRTLVFTFRLEQKVLEGPPVTVTAERSEEWYDRLHHFKRLFIGQSKWAKKCTLVNPKVLRFKEKWWGKFEASAQKPLIIKNRALGYRVTYFLKEFEEEGRVVRWDGEPLFEPLPPRDSTQAAQWAKNRLRAYRGSLRHFLRALIHDRLDEEQFAIYRIPRAPAFRFVNRADRFPLDRDRILKPGPDSTHLLNAYDRIEVVYHGEPESKAYLEWADLRRAPRDYQTSQIELNQPPIHIDPYGKIVEPYGATLYQYFAFTVRIAGLLPREYEPPEQIPTK